MRARDAWFTPRAGRLRRAVAGLVASGNRLLDAVPGTRAFYARQLFGSLTWTELQLDVAWEKIAKYTTPALKAIEVDVTSGGNDLPTIIELVAKK